MSRLEHRSPLRTAAAVTGPAPTLTQAFLGDPAKWLPRPLPLRGRHVFHATLRFAGLPVTVPLVVGGGVIDGERVSRHVRFDLSDTAMGWIIRWLDGYLGVTAAPSGSALRVTFDGGWDSRGIGRLGLGGLWARALARRLVRGVARELAGGSSWPARLRRALNEDW